jgi:cytosine/adenosine deaminase-related metal-dependent hydrolase
MAGAAESSTGRALFDAALTGAARALGVDGGLKVGATADIISLDAVHPALAARAGDDLLDSLIFAGGNRLISGVWRVGQKVVSDGVHHRREGVSARYRRTLARLLA